MITRRGLVAAGAGLAGGALAGPVLAQTAYGLPEGTEPFGPDVFRARRQKVMKQMGGGLAVIYSADSVAEGGRQNPDFAYLTGIYDEAGAALLLAPQERTHKEILFLADRNPESERYEGERLPLGGEVRARSGFSMVSRTSRLASAVAQRALAAPTLHFLGPLTSPPSPKPKALTLYGEITSRIPGTSIVNNIGMLSEMRAAKDDGELALMRKAIEATERGLRAGMRAVRPGMKEFELKEVIEGEFRAAGARRLAFGSIAGSGRNSAVLHYPLDNRVIQSGELVLCDVGAEYNRYAADITRTFPVDRRFTPEQRKVYDLVLAAQEAAARVLKPGAYYEDLQKAADEVFDKAGMRDAFWHGLGHFVGLEVHDAGDYAKPLPVGAVVTIEPGLYLPEKGFGIRIEDEYLVTRTGSEHLTRSVPRTAAEIEAWMAG